MTEQSTTAGVGFARLADEWVQLAVAESPGYDVDESALSESAAIAATYRRCAGDLRRAIVAGRVDSDEDVLAIARGELAAAFRLELTDREGRPPSWAELMTFAATLVPRELTWVMRNDSFDELEVFVSEEQADEYAGVFSDAEVPVEVGSLIVNDERAGAEVIADARAEHGEPDPDEEAQDAIEVDAAARALYARDHGDAEAAWESADGAVQQRYVDAAVAVLRAVHEVQS
jgi:hypothetical protein